MAEEALLAKLEEEAREVAEAKSEELVSELADVMEVLDAIFEANGISREAVAAIKELRRQERGGFARRLKLLWTVDWGT